MNIQKNICELVEYGIENDLISREDYIYIVNIYLDLFKLDTFVPSEINTNRELNLILDDMLDYAVENGLIEDTITYRDLFDTRIMSVMVSKPSQITKEFYDNYKVSPKLATDKYYKFSEATNYIRKDRIKKDMKWKADSIYGQLDITINLSKPEKDPKAIAAARNTAACEYPKCLLCQENVGYAGRINHPARQNHRIIPIKINGEDWGFQYSPYVYYNEHCIVFNTKHIPMKIDKSVFEKLFDFVGQFPHYVIGSNADLPIVGGSILSHEHFQGGNYEFPMAKAPVENKISFRDFDDIEAGIVKWPMSVIRISGADRNRVVELADKILTRWRSYTDEEAYIYAFTQEEPHNTITPIAHMKNGKYELDLVLRNNITTKEHPSGLYHPHAELHHIKKENIGLIEVMGLAVLPSRLKHEMELLKEYIIEKKDIKSNDEIAKHYEWVQKYVLKHSNVSEDNIDDILKEEIGKVFVKVLENSGVFGYNQKGILRFQKFIEYINQ